jgi:hypothetical protein
VRKSRWNTSQIILRVLSALVVLSMICGLMLTVVPRPPEPTATPVLWTLTPMPLRPSLTPTATPASLTATPVITLAPPPPVTTPVSTTELK